MRFLTTTLSVTVALATIAAADAAHVQFAAGRSCESAIGVEFVVLDKTWTLGAPENEHGSQIPAKKALASRVSF